MKIESEEILFVESRLSQLKLTDLQLNYLQVLLQQKTIEKTFLFYLRQGWLINFNEFYSLISKILQKKAIHNLNFYHIFDNRKSNEEKSPYPLNSKTEKTSSSTNLALKEKPFFRNLSPEVFALFEKNSQVIDVPEKSLLIREGSLTREMYYLIEGKLAVYKTRGQQKIRIADLDPGSVFGEASFLWAAPRSADVVTQSNCKLLRINYNANDFADLIQSDLAQKNQIRFWELHAIMKSQILRDLPYNNLDELLNSGKQRNLKANEVLFSENSIGTSFYILVQGHLKISQKNIVINQLSQGDLFGEVSLFVSGGRRTATAKATTDSVLIEIEKDSFYKIISRNLFLACEIESLAWDRIQNDRLRMQA